MAQQQNKEAAPDYSYEVQKLYIEMFMSDAETFVRCQNIFEPLNFDRKLQDVAKFITEYVNEYKVMPEPTLNFLPMPAPVKHCVH